MSSAPKAICIVLAVLGIVTAAVCVWVLASPVDLRIKALNVSTKYDCGNAPKIGLATAILMILLGIAVCFINLEKRYLFFAGGILISLILSIAFMSVAIKDHQDWKLVHDFQEQIKNNINSGFTKNNFNVGRDFSRQGAIFDDEVIKSAMTRLKIIAAAGGIDSVLSIIGLIVFFVKRPQQSARNVMQMDRKI